MKCLYNGVATAHEPRKCTHNHDEHGHHHHAPNNIRALKFSLFITIGAMILQFIYALITNSLALMSDTLHMLTHALALGISWFASFAASNWTHARKTFGYYRFEILAAFVNSISAGIFSVIIVFEAVHKLISPDQIDASTMLLIAAIGLVVNIITGLIMLSGDMENLNIKSSFLHMMSDLLSSVAIILGGAVVYFSGAVWVDSVLALIIAGVVGKWSFNLAKESVNILLEASPIDLERVKSVILKDSRVLDAHDIHVSQITQKMNVLTAHVLIRDIAEFEQILQNISRELEKIDITHVTIQPEWQKLSFAQIRRQS